MSDFALQESSKLISRKIMKFSHCSLLCNRYPAKLGPEENQLQAKQSQVIQKSARMNEARMCVNSE